MSNEQILKKAIKKAIKNGWKVDYKFNGRNVKVKNDSEGLPTFYWIKEDMRQQARDIIFNHDFAKAFWGEEIICPFHENNKHRYSKYAENYKEGEIVPDDVVRIGFKNNKCGICGEKIIHRWQYHLQQMVLEKNPLKYLERFL
jgi:hypothetical protein